MAADPTAGPPSDPPDPEAMLDRLIEVGAVREDADGTLRVSAALDDALDVYEQSYGDVPDQQFTEAVADAFGLSYSEAVRRIDEEGVTREEFVAYLALRSHFEHVDEPVPDSLERASMAAIVTEIAPATPVPQGMREITDDDLDAFLADNESAVVFVWRLRCDPCESMKAELEETLDAIPDGVAVAGVDGEACPEFRRRFDVDVAPAVACVHDGEAVAVETSYVSPAEIADLVERAFDSE
ncbi:thioredoxin family protein [Halobaculum sp. CBA1158]|uniref:thioredoxin family protein n=1 Tax=Halobaculum sp. CBA1158 TaxID=2904243 RepID=UPI001F418FA8|nr:thioredoxin family protein [Halobaculum sp. CBA1158]UIP00252.1 thioredoxin family protein [Halobaculum sp. CBA1158]